MTSFLRTLCWAVYLGCSWTWCIGMFLPVILVSEFGNIAWFVFAIPNVLGAAAMGWTLSKPGASERIVTEHRSACVAFSAVTLALHLFFLYWMSISGMIPVRYSLIAVIAGIALGGIARRQIRLDFFLGVAVLVISVAVLASGLRHPVFGVAGQDLIAPNFAAMPGLTAVCILGFLFCPYLDLTFHRARQQTAPFAGKLAFGLGFGLVFLPMIVLTLLYAGDFAGHYWYDDSWSGSFTKPFFLTWVSLHIAAQIGFTLAVHLRALPRPRRGDGFIWITAVLLVAFSIFAMHQQKWFDPQRSGLQMLTGDLIYRLFMAFYGLIFPAYVWICMVPLRGRSRRPSRSASMMTGIAIAIAAPMFWMGFINARTMWLIPAVGVVFAARFFVRSSDLADFQPV